MKYAGLAVILAIFLLSLPLLAQRNAVPFVNQPLVPASASPGGSGFTLVVNGTGFASSAVVTWNGSPRTTSFVSAFQLKASIAASDIATAGTATLAVVNPGPGGGTSNSVFFPVAAPGVAVALTGSLVGNQSAYFVVVGDFNRDGEVDLVEIGLTAITVLLGNGDGTFQSPKTYSTGGTQGLAGAVGDFNGDGKLDVVVADANGLMCVLLGNGDGTFQNAVTYPAGSSPWSIATGDFNADGNLDVVVANAASNSVSIFLGNGDGSFQGKVDYSTSDQPRWVAIGDFNSDGSLDLAVANYGASQVSILLGNGNGTFQSQTQYNTGAAPRSIAVADYNHDGILDLAVTDENVAGLSLLFGDGDGTFQKQAVYGTGATPDGVAAGDLNGDGNLDVVVADLNGNKSTGAVSVLLGNGLGAFQKHVDYPSLGPAYAVAVGDFNGDGKLDIAAAISNYTSVLLQTTLTVSASSLNFPVTLVGTSSKSQTVQLRNVGGTPLTISNIAFSGNDVNDFARQNNCGTGLASGASCSISVSFVPQDKNPRNSTLTITDSAVGSPQQVGVSGIGTVVKLVPPGGLFFGGKLVGSKSKPQLITLTNVGSTPLKIQAITLTGDQSDEYLEKNNCPSSVPPGGSCKIGVVFAPTKVGTADANVSITDDGGASPQLVPLFGVGT